MRKVYLHGAIGEKYGDVFELEVQTAGEALRALGANFPSIMQDFKEGSWHVVRGEEIDTGLDLGEDDLNSFNLGKGDLHFVPAVAGSKRGGLLKIILGVALVGVGFFMGGFAAPIFGGATGMLGGITYGHMMIFGAALILGGASQLLSPEQKNKDTDKESSFMMSGPGNTYDQGYPVPLIYGEVITGSVMISAGVDVEKIAVGS